MEYSLCHKPPKNVNFFINAIIHVFILLTIISVFFFVYVSQLAKDKFRTELSDVVDDNLVPALEGADKDKIIKNLLKNIDPTLSQAANYYNRENDTTKLENKWLMGSTIAIIVGLIIMTIAILVILKIFCRKIPFGMILRENALLFTLIGTVEILFFLYIAKNFIPTKPTLIMETVITSLKNNFS